MDEDLVFQKSIELEEIEYYKWLYDYLSSNSILYIVINETFLEPENRYKVVYKDFKYEESFEIFKNNHKKVNKHTDNLFLKHIHKITKEIKPENGLFYEHNKGLFNKSIVCYYTLNELLKF